MAGQNILTAASAAPKVLSTIQPSTTGDTSVYTAPSTGSAVVKHAVMCNITSSPVSITKISIVPSGGTIDNTHHVVSNYSLDANDSTVIDELIGCCLGPGDSIHVQVATATAVDFVITGMENT